MSYLYPAVHCLSPIAFGLAAFCVKQMLQGSENKEWQGKANRRLRSVDATSGWLMEQRGGGFMATMSKIVGSLSDSNKIKTMGFPVPRNNGAAPADAGEVLFHDSMAALAGKYHLQLAGNRIARQYQSLRGWLWGCVMLLSDDEDVVKACMTLLHDVYQGFLDLEMAVKAGPIQ